MTRCQPVSLRMGVMASDTSRNRKAQIPVVSVMSSIGLTLSRPVAALNASHRNGVSAARKTRGLENLKRMVAGRCWLLAVGCWLLAAATFATARRELRAALL